MYFFQTIEYSLMLIEYYLRLHSRNLRQSYKDTINTIIDNQVYAVDAVKLEFLFKKTLYPPKVSLFLLLDKNSEVKFTLCFILYSPNLPILLYA